VLPPDVNASVARFSSVGDDIRFGLAAIRNVGANVVEAIIRARKEKGPYTDFYDFLRKVDPVVCNKKTIESLIKAGAFDSLGHPRRGLLAVHADAVDSFMEVKRNEAAGQFDLFAGMFGDDPQQQVQVAVTPPIPDGEWSKQERLTFEREMLGLYVSDHPLRGLEHVLSREADTSIAQLSEEGVVEDGKVVTLAGILTGVQRRITKQGKPWASAMLEDMDGGVEVLFFPSTYELVGQYVAEDAIVVVRGRIDRRDEQARLMAMDLKLPDLTATASGSAKPIVLQLPPSKCTPPLIKSLKQVLASHPGSVEVHLRLLTGGSPKLFRLGPDRVAHTPALMADLKELLGPNALA
jgi:DNA polymerase-3 subunit alpha